MVSCVFPGSFDPVTKGHLDLIARASVMFDRVTVTVMHNIQKIYMIPAEKRVEMLEAACKPFGNVHIERWDGLLSDYMQLKNEKILLRGFRSLTELDKELYACNANKMLNNRIETLFLPSDPAMTGISSSAVREIMSFGGNIDGFVPEGLTEEIKMLLSKIKH